MLDLQEAYEARSSKVNKIEKTKELKTPEDAWTKLEDYAQNGYGSIPAEDLSYFLKCFGVFDRPATPKQFMIRVRIPGGQLTSEQAEVVGRLARDYGNDYIDITTRMQIEYRYMKIADIPTVLKELKAVGISSYQTGVDNFRNILNDPLDGLGMDNILPSQELLLKLQSKFLHKWEWISALPRKFNTGISGSMSNRSNVFGQDCCFVLAQKDGHYGYNLYLGGKVGRIAKSANIFLKNEEEVQKAFAAIIELFRDNGFRDNRNKNRLFFLIEAVGMDKLTEAIREKSGIDFAESGDTLTIMENLDPKHGKVELKDGTYAVHAVIPSGIFKGSDLILAAESARRFGNGGIRFDVEQSLYITGVKEQDMSAILHTPFFENYKNVDTPYFNNMIACAGTEHCPFGVIPNKPDAIEMSEYLSKAVPLKDGLIRMYWSACVKGCGIHGVGDIGFEGCKAKVDGKPAYGVHVTLGGKLTGEGEEGYSVLKTVPLLYAKFYIESLVLEYRRLKKHGESFEKFNDRILTQYSRAFIGFSMVLNAYFRHKNIDLRVEFKENVSTGKHEEFELFELGRTLYHKLFDEDAYSAYEGYAPAHKEKLKPLQKMNSDLDETLANIIYKMIHPDKDERVEVFSELLEEVKY
ncbi:ferredoxin--nitrite reductase [Sulfurimonas sp. MAG313]|nr:ferredoxin--nitrite reductase [Sulfurimonas sp. MAG313]